jgi:Asp-tRNA(Asn)/Glu-tRNA(Gln) amidotransferase B subunit
MASSPVTPSQLASLVQLIDTNVISGKIGKDVRGLVLVLFFFA